MLKQSSAREVRLHRAGTVLKQSSALRACGTARGTGTVKPDFFLVLVRLNCNSGGGRGAAKPDFRLAFGHLNGDSGGRARRGEA